MSSFFSTAFYYASSLNTHTAGINIEKRIMTRMKRRTILSTVLVLLLFFNSTSLCGSLLASAFTPPPTTCFASSTRGVVGAAVTVTTATAFSRRCTLLLAEPQKETTVMSKAGGADADEEKKVDDVDGTAEQSEQNLLDRIKEAGTAGVISYAFWELAFWLISIPVTLGAYVELTGHWPDFANQDDLAKLGAEAFAFVNLARLAVPIRIGLAISTIPWVEENVVERFSLLKDKDTTSDATKEAAAAADEQKGSENGDNVVNSSMESKKVSTVNEQKKGLVRRIVSRLPFRRHSNE
jgi:hypothetical protein